MYVAIYDKKRLYADSIYNLVNLCVKIALRAHEYEENNTNAPCRDIEYGI